MAWESRLEEWSRPPEPSPDASGMLVQLPRAATECEFDLVPEPGQVMQKGLDLGSRTAKGGTHDAVIMNLTPKCPCEARCGSGLSRAPTANTPWMCCAGCGPSSPMRR